MKYSREEYQEQYPNFFFLGGSVKSILAAVKKSILSSFFNDSLYALIFVSALLLWRVLGFVSVALEQNGLLGGMGLTHFWTRSQVSLVWNIACNLRLQWYILERQPTTSVSENLEQKA